jgi:hypothetical protein
MLTNVSRVIFHDVPKKRPGGVQANPLLSDIETSLDATQRELLRSKLVQVIGSKSASSIQFDEGSTSPAPETVQRLTEPGVVSDTFIEASQQLAKHLFTTQNPTMSAGLLCVMDLKVGEQQGLAILKLEREEGAQLELTKTPDGHQTFSMDVLHDLVLTEGTRLFKCAMFKRQPDRTVTAAACDRQLGPAPEALAQFWLRFLGCKFTTLPRVATRQFFEAATELVASLIEDPVKKTAVYESLRSEMNAEGKKFFSPRTFVDEYVPKDSREPFLRELKERGIPLSQFRKDTTDISRSLRRREYTTAHGIKVTAAEEDAARIDVQKSQVVIRDAVKKVR